MSCLYWWFTRSIYVRCDNRDAQVSKDGRTESYTFSSGSSSRTQRVNAPCIMHRDVFRLKIPLSSSIRSDWWGGSQKTRLPTINSLSYSLMPPLEWWKKTSWNWSSEKINVADHSYWTTDHCSDRKEIRLQNALQGVAALFKTHAEAYSRANYKTRSLPNISVWPNDRMSGCHSLYQYPIILC